MKKKVEELLKEAVDACDNHSSCAKRDVSLSTQFDDQVRLFSDILRKMLENVNSNSLRPAREGLAYAIADCWPFESWLGKQIVEAEAAYEIAANHSNPAKGVD
jgi:hypothetical protein